VYWIDCWKKIDLFFLKTWKGKEQKMNQNNEINYDEEEEEEFLKMNDYKNIVGEVDYDTFTYEYDKQKFWDCFWEYFIEHLTEKYNLKKSQQIIIAQLFF
jgi:hypothetical protein